MVPLTLTLVLETYLPATGLGQPATLGGSGAE
jgi:hypothetical protein